MTGQPAELPPVTPAKKPSILRLHPSSAALGAHPLGRLMRLIRPVHKKYLLGLTLRVALTTIERVVIAFLAKSAIDAMTQGTVSSFRSGLLAWVLFYLGYVAVAPFVINLWRSAVYEATTNVRSVVFQHLNRLPLGYHEAHHSGDALSILTNDVAAAEQAYQDDLLRLVEASAQGLAGMVAMLLLNWQLALLIILSGMAPLIVNSLFAGPLRKIGQQVQAHLGGVSERMTDLLAGYQVVRTFNLGAWILERFERDNDRVLDASLKRVRIQSALAAANDFAGLFGLVSFAAGGYFALVGLATFGVMIALIQLSNNIAYFAYSIGGTISRIQSALAATDRILALMDAPLEPDAYPALPSQVASTSLSFSAGSASPAAIEFRNVVFGYTEGENVLNSLSFDVREGRMVAFAGPSGGGKSTIFKLLLGCYPIQGGEIRLSGVPIWDYRLADLRDLFAYVPQDAYLFAGTIYENIRYGNLNANEDQIIAAATAAYADDFISEFPKGYRTVVGERGARLSGGQRQRIAIARALLKDAPILLMDEATSALDSESEEVVQRALEVLMRGRTTLVIAHRFSTIVHSDMIYVIEDGRVVEQGKHEDLMSIEGIYHALFDMQFRLEKDGAVAELPALGPA